MSATGERVDSREDDRRWMRRAIELAERGWGQVSPNPLVGAVCVLDGQVVGEGWHARLGEAHAERVALGAAGERARGSTLYVTLEPCDHHGRTPPCTDAVIESGVRRVVIAMADPNPGAGEGRDRLRAEGIEVTEGVLEEDALDLNAPFAHRFDPSGARRPWIALKLALSADGKMADADGRSFWITGKAARLAVHRERARMDAIAVGIGTVLADDPALTVRGACEPRRPPRRVVFDRRLRMPITSRLVSTAAEAPVEVICEPGASRQSEEDLRARGVTVRRVEDLEDGMLALREEGIDSLYVEGGANFAAALLEHGVVDRLDLFFAPIFIGAGGISPFSRIPDRPLETAVRWRPIRSEAIGSDTLIRLAAP